MRLITLKRVPLGFDWPINSIWFGYIYDPIPCELCLGIGNVNWPDENTTSATPVTQKCPLCKGEGKVTPVIDVPMGRGYQIWETMNYMEKNANHYYPISPVYADSFKLAEWMSENYVINGDKLMSEATWHEAIQDNNIDTVFGLYRENIQCF